MGEHKNKAGSPAGNGLHGSEPRTRQTWSTMSNDTKHLFMAVLVVMAGALLSMVPSGKILGYIVSGIGFGLYVVLRLVHVWQTRHSSKRAPGAQ
ncbi:MAG: hypothetical protein ACYDH4_01565 [Candidatus Cryosericum sp.]